MRTPSARRLFALLTVLIAGCGGSQRPRGGPAPRAAAPPQATTNAAPTGDGPIASAAAAWPALLHGPSHFGAARVAGPRTGRVRWQRKLEGAVVPGAVATAAGVAYVASNGGVLHAIDVASGRDRWRFDGGGRYGSDLSTAPLVLGDGRVIWPGPRHQLFGLGAGGRQRWTLGAGSDLLTPVLDPSTQLLVVADQNGRISGYRLPHGPGSPTLVWSRKLATSSFGNPAVAANGTIYETAGNSLFALAGDGRVRWKVDTPNLVEVSPAVAENGVVVFGSNDRREYGVDPSGRVRWRASIGDFTYSSPLTLAGNRVIFGNHSGQMNVLDTATGQLLARDQGRGQLWTAATVDVRGNDYFASRTGDIFGFDRAGRRLFDLHVGSTFDSYPALAADGTLLIGADNGILYALR